MSAGLLSTQPLFIAFLGGLVSVVSYSKCTPQGCGLAVKWAVLLWPPVFPAAFWPHLVQSTTGRVEKPFFLFFLRKKKGCLCWSFNFVSNQWAGPAHCAAACLLGPAGMAVGKAELNCPSSSSQPLKKFGTDRCSPMSGGQSQRPCLIRTASTRKPGFG